MRGRISKMPRNNTQIGSATTSDWVLDFEPGSERHIDPLMGWTQTADTESSQVQLHFDTKEDAVRYAEAHGIAFQLADPKPAKRIIKAYADNFAFGRKVPWTH